MGHGQVKPIEAKVEAISNFPVPTCKRQLMRFLGMAGYYRKLCRSEIQDGRHGSHLENLFFSSSPEPKGQLTRNLVGAVGRLVDQK